MRMPLTHRPPARPDRRDPTLPPGTGFVIVGAASLLMWAIIASVATIL